MAYQNVGTPRFFIDNYKYLRAIGLNPEEYINETSSYNQSDDEENKTPLDNPNAFTLSPEISKGFSADNDAKFYIPCGEMVNGMDFSGNMKWYGALLNHNLGTCNAIITKTTFNSTVGNSMSWDISDNDFSSILNANVGAPTENGTSIWFSDNNPVPQQFDEYYLENRFAGFHLEPIGEDGSLSDFQVGAISMGVMYTMPKSPDLDLSITILNDGIDKATTLGGADLTNIRYTGAPTWANNNKFSTSFGVGDYSEDISLNGAKRSGRREWDLKFTHISDSDLFSSNYMHNNYLEDDADNYNDSDINATGDGFEYNMFTDDSFIAQVWNKTLGGGLRFIFQPDSNNNNPDQFCIAKFDEKSLDIKQIAYRSYEISVKIRETW